MGEIRPKRQEHICMGVLAHVDAGKTTLTEAMLYLSGRIKKLGRVDHRDSFLDTHELERSRGITIFAKQAIMPLGDKCFTILDTPGHVDFSTETERTLQVLDAAVLVISGTDGVQAHTETLWELLRKYQVPVFVFVTKMDLVGADKESVMQSLRRLSGDCVDFSSEDDEIQEKLAMCSEKLMDKYLEGERINNADIAAAIAERAVFPCFFGSGLKTDGVEELLAALEEYTCGTEDSGEFSARVYKIARDAQGKRMSYLKITGGELKTRDAIEYTDRDGVLHQDKISQIRLYSGTKYEAVESVGAGQICAVLGLDGTYAGQGLGAESDADDPQLQPVLSYRLILPKDTDPRVFLPKLRELQEEDPLLSLVWNEQHREIHVQLMGKVQTEVLQSLIKERFDTEVTFGAGKIMYRETVTDRVEGVGHFEPLRHYAEVHLIIEPLPQGSGIELESVCSEDELDRNWQRLILTHLMEKQHLGVLTGSPITDVKISLAAGRAHVKHTEGGDFRQATYRALRQGLMKAKSQLLEPYYSFAIEVPAEQMGRVINDIRAMSGAFESPEESGEMMRIVGSAPVSEMSGYAADIAAFTHGRGKISFRVAGYRPCHNSEKVIEEAGYAPLSDIENTPDSVFCAHGAGFNVRWNEVESYMHLNSCLEKPKREEQNCRHRGISIDERELEAIMEREFGPIKRPQYSAAIRNEAPKQSVTIPQKKERIIVDAYNVIFAWDELKNLAKDRLDLARGRLLDMLSNYCGYTKAEMVVVFDAYRSPGNRGSRSDYHNIHVVYTPDGETGDAYIERIANDIGKNYSVRVVTSDNLIRLSALRSGVLRCSAKEFEQEVDWVLTQIDEVLRKSNEGAHKTRVKDGKQ